MATFKVGMRVKIVSTIDRDGHDWSEAPIGCEGVIARRAPRSSFWHWIVDIPTHSDVSPMWDKCLAPTEWYADSCMLAPLTDPLAE